MDGVTTLRVCFSLVFGCSILSACSSATPTKVLESHGDSVRNMVAEQTYEPGDDVADLDGEKARAIQNTYRQDVSNPKKVEKPIIKVTLD